MAKKKTASSNEAVKELLEDKRLKAMKVTGKTEEDIRAKLLQILTDNDIPEMEDSTTEELIEFAHSVYEDDAPAGDNEEELVEDEEEQEEELEESEEPEDEEQEEEPEEEILEEEIVEEVKKAKKKTAVKKEKVIEDEDLDGLAEESEGVDTKSRNKKKRSDVGTKKKSTSKRRRNVGGIKWDQLKPSQRKEALVPFLKIFPEDKI